MPTHIIPGLPEILATPLAGAALEMMVLWSTSCGAAEYLGDLVGEGEDTLVGSKSVCSDSRLREGVPYFSLSQEEGFAVVILSDCGNSIGKGVLMSSRFWVALERRGIYE